LRQLTIQPGAEIQRKADKNATGYLQERHKKKWCEEGILSEKKGGRGKGEKEKKKHVLTAKRLKRFGILVCNWKNTHGEV